jgi:hypothetical protein
MLTDLETISDPVRHECLESSQKMIRARQAWRAGNGDGDGMAMAMAMA